ncbi:uncharacterized protein [Physcomitrium patens]|nr:uncharacterized protein LOC112279497 isoform X2 [Physcomitrium patens]XP_024369761.1 uncharacterized protein LOC112279497 isoform X2 [Physcomitrium patens]PNR57456.1 hypothetical protein PHYPA_004450 [Physcomitrium patens]|eukprot:XP_024369760.1 uncharacterized protein LOC112279497 isoform X2 [Physcomitrella patens]
MSPNPAMNPFLVDSSSYAAESPWMALRELEQQRTATSQSHSSHDVGVRQGCEYAKEMARTPSDTILHAELETDWFRSSDNHFGPECAASLSEDIKIGSTHPGHGNIQEAGMRHAQGEDMVESRMDRESSSPFMAVHEADGSAATQPNNVELSQNSSLSLSGSGGDSDEEWVRNAVVSSEAGERSGKRKSPNSSATGEFREADFDKPSSDAAELMQSKYSESATLRRRKKNVKTLRKPIYAIETRTDVDIMDDGFKWRKYGQKAVKNSPYPRNYYRCTTPQCPVRKRVERSCEDSGLVITTYEGTHTHQTPGLFSHPSAASGHGLPESKNPLGHGFEHFQIPRSPSLLPHPTEVSALAVLQHMRIMQQLQDMSQQQIAPPDPLLAGSLQQESLLRAQQFLGLYDHPTGAIDRESFQYLPHARGSVSHAPSPYPSRPSFHPTSETILDRMHMLITPQHMRSRGTPEQSLHPATMDLDYHGYQHQMTSSPSQCDDLVRRVLEAEEEGPVDVDVRDGSLSSDAKSDPASASSETRTATQSDFVTQLQTELRNRMEKTFLPSPTPPPPKGSVRRRWSKTMRNRGCEE